MANFDLLPTIFVLYYTSSQCKTSINIAEVNGFYECDIDVYLACIFLK
jgi:hypothetical protein